ncbi:hypothetical protein [Burkholderia phage BCSR52]|uniref:Uncharacterized protein n=1 Tax=Burkholderia phage BCSR52 TaxID=2805748 RepID=A0A889IRS2_9CAUD|nr:hypothetical protein [Burkholderia phage BCSR52]
MKFEFIHEKYSEDQLTDWSKKGEKPLHVGVYEVENIIGTADRFFAKWDGVRWSWCNYTVESADCYTGGNGWQDYRFRGLKEDPFEPIACA